MTTRNTESLPGMDAYRTEIDRLRFSPDAKARMAARMATAATKENPMNPYLPTRETHRLPLAAAVAAFTLVLGLGGIAYATGGMIDVAQFVHHLFGVADAKVEVVDKVGRAVGVAQSVNGVTVSADAVVGDKTNVAAIFSIYKDDGTPFEGVKAHDNDLLPLGFSEDIDVNLLPRSSGWSAGGNSYFYDADPNDNAIQLVETRSFESDGEDNLNLVGRTMTAHFSNLTLYDGDEATVIAPGDWKLSFPLNYEDASIELPGGQTFELAGIHEDDMADVKEQVGTIPATIDELCISPLALHLSYSVDQKTGWAWNESDQESERNSRLSDVLLGVDATVTLRDGSSFDLNGHGGAISPDGDVTRCECGILFDRIVDVSEVASVTIGGTTIELG